MKRTRLRRIYRDLAFGLLVAGLIVVAGISYMDSKKEVHHARFYHHAAAR